MFLVHIFVFPEWDVSNGGFNITPRGAPEILTISFTGVFSLALNAVQFTFEIRCRGEQNMTRHVGVVVFLVVAMFFIHCLEVSEDKRASQKGNISWFLFALTVTRWKRLSYLGTQSTYFKQLSFTNKNNNNNAPRIGLNQNWQLWANNPGRGEFL